MNFLENLLSIDYSSYGLSSIDQLVFIKISYGVFGGKDITTSFLCTSCSCSKPTLHLSISKLEMLNLITVVRASGCVNTYSLEYSCIDFSLSELEIANNKLNKMIDDFNAPIPDIPVLFVPEATVIRKIGKGKGKKRKKRVKQRR